MVRPVTVPPGRAKLWMSPFSMGSAAVTVTMGMVALALRAAWAAAVPGATITSTFSRTRSAASSGNRSSRPSANRNSMTTSRPSTYPRSLRPCRKPSLGGGGPDREPPTIYPIRATLAGCASAMSGGATSARASGSPRIERRVDRNIGRRALSHGGQGLAAGLHRLGVDQDHREHTGLGTTVDPVVDRAPLHHDVARGQVDHGPVQLHVDLTRDDDDVVDGIRAVVTRGHAGGELDHAEDRAPRQRGGHLPEAGVLGAVVVGGKALGRPDIAHRGARPPRDEVRGHLVDLHDRAARVVVARDDPPHPQCHVRLL